MKLGIRTIEPNRNRLFWGARRILDFARRLFTVPLGLKLGLPVAVLLAFGCGSGKNYHTFDTDPGTWPAAAARLCPNVPDYATRLKEEFNYGDATPKEADTRWFYIKYLQGGFRIAVPDPLCPKPGEKPIEVVPLPEPLRPTPDAGVAEVREEVLKPDVYEVNPDAGVADVPMDVPVDTSPADVVEVIPDVRPDTRHPHGPKDTGGQQETPPIFRP
jgi:hypothetical protein